MRVDEELKTYLQVLWRYKWMVVACAIITSLVTLGISLQLTPLYSAMATLRVASYPGGATDYTYISSLTRLSNTYVEIATSDISLKEVAERLGLQKQPIVQVDVVPETELITISASDPDPILARDIANTLASMMVEQSVHLYGGNAPTAREILEGQLQQAKVDLDNAIYEYDNTIRGAQSSVTLPPSGTPIPNPDADTLAHLVYVRQQIYTDLLQRYEAARTSEQLRANAITIFEPAFLPQYPATPRIPLNTALGVLAGLATGVILAFVFEGMDDTLRGIEDVQVMTTVPILCTIPELKRSLSLKSSLNFSRDGQLSSLLALAQLRAGFTRVLSTNTKLNSSRNGLLSLAPFIHQLRARLILSNAKPKSATFLIASPEPGVGKSTIAANVAVSLAEGGNRVVLIDMDFHRPCLHSILGLPNDKGLSEYMCGKIQLNAVLQDAQYPNLRVATAGSSQDGTSEWFAPEKIGALLERLDKDSDYVLIDAPALLSVADPVVIASQADAVILVVARRRTGRQHLRLALQQLTELKVKVAGIVVNRVPNSQLYSYYSEQHSKPIALLKGKITSRKAVDALNKRSDIHEE